MHEAAVFIIYNSASQQVLVEKRLPTSSYAPDQLVFPGGKVEANDNSIDAVLLREMIEEIGIFPTQFQQLQQLEVVERNYLLYPYLITQWDGEIPDAVLDKGNSLLWVPLQVMESSILFEVSLIAQMTQAQIITLPSSQ